MPMPTFRKASDLPDQMSAEHNTTPRQPAPSDAPKPPRTNKYAAKCADCDGTVPAEQGSLTNEGGKWVTRHFPNCDAQAATPAAEPEREVNVVNGQPLYDGIYTYETLTAYRTFRLRTQETDADFMPGVQIIQHLTGQDNDNDYQSIGHVVGGQPRIWKKHQDKQTLVTDVRQFFADPQQALQAAQCFLCHRTLTVPTSIHNGLGPECAKKGF